MKELFLAVWLTFSDKQNHTLKRILYSFHTQRTATQNMSPPTCDGPILQPGGGGHCKIQSFSGLGKTGDDQKLYWTPVTPTN